MLSCSFFPNFGQGTFPKIAGKSPVISLVTSKGSDNPGRTCVSCSHTQNIEYDEGSNQTLYSKTGVKQPLSKRPNIGFQDQLMLNAGQKYCRKVKSIAECSKTFIKLPFVI